MKQVSIPVNDGVKISDAFFSPKLERFYNVTVPDCFEKFEAEKTFDNWRNAAAGKGEHYRHSFYDGLIYELIRGASDYPQAKGDKALEERIDAYIELFAAAQDYEGDGFVDTYTTLVFPKQRFGFHGGNTIWQHNTYNQGCLLEAGLHYYRTTGKTRLLEMAIKSMNYLSDHIGPAPKWNVSPEHSMIEGSLAELCDLMEKDPDLGKKLNVPLRERSEYLELCDYFVHSHGHHEGRMTNPRYLGEYSQDHAPVELQTEAVGHAVRAVLFYRGIAMLARLKNDDKMWEVARTIWKNITREKMFINGGVGTSKFEEKFSWSYDLPNDGYMETCATAAMIFYACEMTRLDLNGEYADVVETSLYNLMLEAVSDSGDEYTYVNPMQSDGSIHRWQWNVCPCCPPMINKVFGRVQELIYSKDADSLIIHQYIGSTLKDKLGSLKIKGNYPWDGNITVTVTKASAALKNLKVRIPCWCEQYTVTVNGNIFTGTPEKGYLTIPVSQGDVVKLALDMPVRRVQAHPYVRQDNGHVAIRRGPIVYCLEGIDNKGDSYRVIPENWEPEIVDMPALCGGVKGVTFRDVNGKQATAVPYFAWDNRCSGTMHVWQKQDKMKKAPDMSVWDDQLYRFYE